MNTPISFLLLVVLIHLGAAGASSQKKTKSGPCPNALSQFEMTQCAHKEYLKADAALNKVYVQLTSILDDEEKSQLKEVQITWIKYRDGNCNFVADKYKGGTMRPMVFAFCLAQLTDQRTALLRSQLKDRTL